MVNYCGSIGSGLINVSICILLCKQWFFKEETKFLLQHKMSSPKLFWIPPPLAWDCFKYIIDSDLCAMFCLFKLKTVFVSCSIIDCFSVHKPSHELFWKAQKISQRSKEWFLPSRYKYIIGSDLYTYCSVYSNQRPCMYFAVSVCNCFWKNKTNFYIRFKLIPRLV